MRSVELISAGGIAIRDRDSHRDVALIKTESEGRWQLPKGIIDPGETPEQAALREVREEAGISCEIINKVDVIDYWFVNKRSHDPERIHKFVHFFLMRYLSGDISDHDDEVFEARWVHFDDAISMLSFEAERCLLRKALKGLK